MKVLVCLKKAIVAAAIILLFSSCENFLASGNIKENIKNKIDYNEAKTVQVNLECDHEMGTIYPEGYYSAKLGFAFEIQFVPNTEKYVIKNKSEMLEAVSRLNEESRTDYVEFTYLDQTNEDKKQGLYRINVKIVKAAEDLKIQPLVTERPKVVDVYPPYNPSGVNQDTTISVTFNKAVNPQSFGDYSCIKFFDSEKNDITDYYDTPFFSNDNTVLQIRKATGKLIIPEQSEKTSEDISLEIDFSNIVDTDGIYFPRQEPFSFRVNKSLDKVKPVITSVTLKTSSDPSSSYYHTLTTRPFEQWNNTATQGYAFGHFSQNHVGSEIHIEASGYDKDSSISGIQIVETFYKEVSGQDATLGTKTVVSGVNKFKYSSTDDNNNIIYSLNDSYKFASINDGIFKLDISVIDNAGNISSPITYYVLKDTSIESNAIQFEETQSYDKYRPITLGAAVDSYKDIFEDVRTLQGTDDIVVLTLKDSSVDTFYEGCSTQYNIEMYYGYSQEKINTRVPNENNTFTLVRNPELLTFITFKISDEAGNKIEFLRVIPPSPKISSFTVGTVHGFYSGFEDNYVKIVPKYSDLYSSMCNSCGADSFGVFYIVKNNAANYANYATTLEGRSQILDNSGNEQWKEYNFYIVLFFKYGETYWYSVLSDEYLSFPARKTGEESRIKSKTMKDEYDNEYQVFEVTLVTTNNSQAYTTSFGPYMKDNLQATIEPCLGTGGYIITLDDYKEPAIDTSNIIYTFECLDLDNSDIKYIFSEPSFYLPSMAKYKIYVYAKEKNGTGYYRSPWCYCYVNGASSCNQQYSFLLDKDLSAPSFDDQGYKHTFARDTAAYWIMEPFSLDDNPQTARYGEIAGMREDPDDSNYGLLDYYFVPNSNTSANAYSAYTLQDLQAYEKHTLRYKFTDTSLKIPYGYLEEGLYTICLVAEDKNGNHTIKCAPAFNKTLGYKVPITFNYVNDRNYVYTIVSVVAEDDDQDGCVSEEETANSRGRNFNLDLYDSNNKQWERISIFDPDTDYRWGLPSDWTFGFGKQGDSDYNEWIRISGPRYEFKLLPDDTPYNNINEYGFHLTDYLYIPYEKARTNPTIDTQICTRKTVYALQDKYMVLCDNSVFVHTMYCQKKLTETTTEYDLALWETKGEETGIFVHTGPVAVEDRDINVDYYETHNNFYYTYDYYDDIPDGYYYTTIFHFADGYAYMTDIKQK